MVNFVVELRRNAANNRVPDEISKLMLEAALRLETLKLAFRDYVRTEGCDCCRDYEGHKEASDIVGKLLEFNKYPDSDDYNFYMRNEDA